MSFTVTRYPHQLVDGLSLLRVELVEQPLFPQVKRTPRAPVRRVAIIPVMETPAGGSTRDRSAQVRQVIRGGGIPIGVAATKRFLEMNGNDLAEFLHPGKVFARLRLGLCGGCGITGPVRRNEIDFRRLEVFAKFVPVDVP